MKHHAGSTTRDSAPRTVLAYADELAIPVKLQAAMETDREFRLLSMSTCRTEIVRRAAESQPHVTLFWFQTSSDLIILKELQRAAPNSAIVLCLSHDLPPETARQAVVFGARAFLSTTAGWDTFKECLRLCTGDHKAGKNTKGASNAAAAHPRSSVVSCSSKAR